MGACPACGSLIASGARFCPACGTPLTRQCDRCGAMAALTSRFCDSCGAALQPPEGGAEERKLVTILFADVSGSTALGEQLDPERLRSVLQSYFSSVSDVITSWGGTVEKFIGDAVMAAFGVPAVREDDPERALRAALEMLERLGELNQEFRRRHGVSLQIRIGVNTGEVISPSGPAADQQILAGDAVNVAARLEQAAEPGSVLVGERTYLVARQAFRFGPVQSLSLKGKAERVEARLLLGPAAEPARGIPGLRAPLIGRDRELQTITGHLDEVLETSRPRLLLVNGPAGIGKSRLLAEFVRAAAADHQEIQIMRGRCLAAGHGITFWALGEILRTSAQIALDDSADVAQEKLRRAVGEVLLPLQLSTDERQRTIHALAATAGLSLPDSPLEALNPEATAAELARAWPRFASALAIKAPTVLIIEDLHWAGDQLLEMLERLVARANGRVLLMATARPEFTEAHPGFAAGRDEFSAISLRPLTERQSSELVDELLHAAELPQALRAQILDKAEGNPFFVEELLSRLIDEEGLVHEGGTWRATGTAEEVSLPDSVHALLAARIDALPRQEKRVLQEAAVIGRIFWEEPVARSAGNGAVASALLALEDKGLVYARPSSSIAGQLEYMFKHALVRDVAYAGLPKARRARAHAEAAAWIEELAGQRIDEFIELVAHHYHAAVAGEESDLAWAEENGAREGIRGKAFAALVAAGASARRRYAVSKAVELHQQALDLAASSAERRQALEELGDDHFSVYHGDEALAAYQEARALLNPSARADRARLAEKIGRTCGRWGAFRSKPDPAAMERIVEEGLEDAEDEALRASLLTLRAHAFTFWASADLPDPIPVEQRIAWGKEGLAISERLGKPELVSRAAALLSGLYFEQGEYRAARDASLRQLDLLEQIASREVRAEIQAEASVELLAAGDTERAYELGRAAYELAREMSDHQLMHTSAPLLRAAYWAGRWEEMRPILDEHLRAFMHESDVGCPEVQTGPAIGALLLANLGEVDRARELAGLVAATKSPYITGVLASYYVAVDEAPVALDRLAAVAARSEPRLPRQGVTFPMLEALVKRGDWEGVVEFLPTARSLVEADAALGPMADRAEGLLLGNQGRTDQAVALLRQAVTGFERLRAPFEAARANESLASVASQPEARTALESALESYERLGASPHAARLRARDDLSGAPGDG